MSIGALTVGVVAAAAVFFVFAGLMRRQPQVDLLDARLAIYDEPTVPRTLDEIEMSQPFSERFLRPFIDRIGRRVASLQPRDRAQKLQALIDLAAVSYTHLDVYKRQSQWLRCSSRITRYS